MAQIVLTKSQDVNGNLYYLVIDHRKLNRLTRKMKKIEKQSDQLIFFGDILNHQCKKIKMEEVDGSFKTN